MPKISVIVPVYNVEMYLQKCLDSLVAQTWKDTEIILIDDGSTDGSSTIVKTMQERYPDNIQYVRTENHGQSHARNVGMEMATGEYIAFVDSDDYVEPTMLEQMVNPLKDFPYEVVCCSTWLEYPDKTVEVKPGVDKTYTSMTVEDRKQVLQSMYPVVWNKLYKAEWLRKLPSFKEGVWYEDVLFLYEMLPHLSSIAVVDIPFYHYVQRPQSVTYTYSEKLYDIFTVLDALLAYYKEHDLYTMYQDVLEYEYVRYVYATFIRRLAKAKDKTVFRKGVQFAIEQVHSHFPTYKKNKYIRKIRPKSMYLRWFHPWIADRVYDMDKNKMN